MSAGRIRVGPAGWSYDDWNGRVYPPHPRRDFSRLAWVARFFDVVEVNVSFYRVLAPRVAESWVRQVEEHPDFRFLAKLHQSLTHRGRELRADVIDSYLESLAPLRESGRLGPLLAQFPWSFRPDDLGFDYLRRMVDAFTRHTLAIEVRHGDWAREEAQRALAELDAVVVSVDQPQVGHSLAPMMPPRRASGYVRLHGRNTRSWFDREAGRDARYDYSYARSELTEWTSRIQRIAHASGEVHVITNNHFRGQAVANALELKAMLGQSTPEVPRWLWENLPQLRQTLRAADPQPVEPDSEEPPSVQRALF